MCDNDPAVAAMEYMYATKGLPEQTAVITSSCMV